MVEGLKARNHLFVVNPTSFHYRKDMDDTIAAAKACFRRMLLPEPLMHVSRYPREATAVIRKYVAAAEPDSVTRVYAVGGDGILFDCLNGLVGLGNTELAVVPYGSANDFVRAFGDENKEHFRDISLQATAGVLPTDIINCGHSYALNTCTVGLESQAVTYARELQSWYKPNIRMVPPSLRRFIYNFTFYLGGLFTTGHAKILRQNYQVCIDGQDFSSVYVCINIANGPCYGGDKYPAAMAIPDDGHLDVLLVKGIKPVHYLRYGFKYLYGQYAKLPQFITHRKATRISVRSDNPLVLQMDGEIFFDTNINVEIMPKAVNIVNVKGLPYRNRLPIAQAQASDKG
jgi:diacylglycerol kinase family enzyme